MADPIHQFEIHKIATLGYIGGHEIAFTNSSLYMVIAVGLIVVYFWVQSTDSPSRRQSDS